MITSLITSGGADWRCVALLALGAAAIYWLEKTVLYQRKVIKERDDQLKEIRISLVEVTKDFSETQMNSAHTVTDIATRFTGAIESLIRLTQQSKG
jgi:hypothetical protein